MNNGPDIPHLAVPNSVRGATALLRIQAAIWGLVLLACLLQTSPSLAGQYGAGQAFLTVFALAMLGSFAGGSLYLAARLAGSGDEKARVEVIGLESFMTCFGLAILALALLDGASSAAIAGIAGLIGAGLSAAAAGGLLGSDARRYCQAQRQNQS
jgi:hypothetical protein